MKEPCPLRCELCGKKMKDWYRFKYNGEYKYFCTYLHLERYELQLNNVVTKQKGGNDKNERNKYKD